MAYAAAFLIVVAAAVLLLVWTQQRRLMYFPFGDVPAPAEVGLAEVEEVTFTTADGLALGGWFLRAAGSGLRLTEAGGKHTVLVFNGNAGNRGYRAPLAAALRRHGLNVFLFDYRGYGGNPGSPTEAGLAADSRAARAYLLTRPDVDPERIVYFGESLGAAVAVDLAAEHPPMALVLRSPFTSMAAIGQHHYSFLPVRLLLRDRFDSLRHIGRVRAPLLVVAGAQDQIVPAAHSRELYEAAPQPKTLVVIEGADHNDEALLASEELIDAVVRRIRSAAGLG